jgi:hypothetical protein
MAGAWPPLLRLDFNLSFYPGKRRGEAGAEASSAARSIAGGTRSTMAGVSILYTEILASTGYHRTCFQSRSAI